MKENLDLNVKLQDFNMKPQDVQGVNAQPRPQPCAAAVEKRDQLALELA